METDPLTISIPEALKEFVEDRVREGQYRTASDYVSELLTEDRRRRTEEGLEALLLAGLRSGELLSATPTYWRAKRQALADRDREERDPR